MQTETAGRGRRPSVFRKANGIRDARGSSTSRSSASMIDIVPQGIVHRNGSGASMIVAKGPRLPRLLLGEFGESVPGW